MTRTRAIAIIIAVINAIILTIGTYFMNNSPIFTGENLDLYAWLEFFKGSNDDSVKDSVLFINVAYDKDIASKSINGLPVGTTDVTNRKALLDMVHHLNQADYRYVFLDIRFEDGTTTPYDSALFEAIDSMRNIVIANHENIVLADNAPRKKAAYSDYFVTITATNFTRYQYLRSNGESMPLRAYRELDMGDISKKGWLYFSSGKICQNTLMVKSPISGFDEFGEPVSIDVNSEKKKSTFYTLNKINDAESLKSLAKDKYVVVGNMIDDKHDTYFGKTPGSLLVFSAFWALKKGEHMVKPIVALIFFLLYFGISLSLFSHIPIIEKIPFVKNSKSKMLHFLLSFIGYSAVILIVTSVLYLIGGVISSIWIPALFFSIQRSIISYKHFRV